jgi:hypothetical protein
MKDPDLYTQAVRDLYAWIRVQPRPLYKMFGPNPTEAQRQTHQELMADWRRQERIIRRRMKAAKGA